MPVFGGSNISLALGGQGSTSYTLQAGETIAIPPGTYNIIGGQYSSVQVLDPITTCWKAVGADGPGVFRQITSDGTNYRLANTTGCVVGAAITNAGSGYTAATAPAVTFASGSAKAVAIIGGAVTVSPSVTAGGASYVYPPQVVIGAPPSPGIPATAYCTLSSNAVSTVTITNQGAGYLTPPTVSFVNDPRDTTGQGAAAIATLTGAGTITGILVTDHGTPLTSVPVVTLTPALNGAAATAIVDFTVTGYAAPYAGGTFVAPLELRVTGTGTVGSTAYTNPATQGSLVRYRPASIYAAISTGGITATGLVVNDGGRIAGSTASTTNISLLLNGNTTAMPGTAATLTLTLGGAADFVYMLRA